VSHGKTIAFKLQEGVKFHDGKPFISPDVQFAMMEVLKKVRPRGPGTLNQNLESIVGKRKITESVRS